MADFQQHLSSALRQLRQANGWSLTLTAERTGVSKAMLGQIERGESSPTVATLWKIATGFNVPFPFFIDGSVLPSGAAPGFSQPNADMSVRSLLPYDPQLRFDLLAVELAAGAQSHGWARAAHGEGATNTASASSSASTRGRSSGAARTQWGRSHARAHDE